MTVDYADLSCARDKRRKLLHNSERDYRDYFAQFFGKFGRNLQIKRGVSESCSIIMEITGYDGFISIFQSKHVTG